MSEIADDVLRWANEQTGGDIERLLASELACFRSRLTVALRERDEWKSRGRCQCGDEDECALVRERDAALRALEEGLLE